MSRLSTKQRRARRRGKPDFWLDGVIVFLPPLELAPWRPPEPPALNWNFRFDSLASTGLASGSAERHRQLGRVVSWEGV